MNKQALYERRWTLRAETQDGSTEDLVHWASAKIGVCLRKDSGRDVTTEQSGKATIVHLGVASYYGNITCLRCRRVAWKAGIR